MKRLFALALVWCLAVVPAAAQTFDELGLDVPGEGIQGELVPDAPAFDNTPIQLSPAEASKMGLMLPTQRRAVAADASYNSGDLPPIMITAKATVYERVAMANPAQRRRRSLASRGAPAQSLTRHKTVARRVKQQMDISPIINKYAQKYNLDPWLIRGVIQTESAFRPYAVSPVGAGGLMQLMPGTAGYLGCRDRFDPEQNIAAGARYLRMMMDRFGSADLAIAAYNAGPGNVERYGGIPPFAETQRYVVKVKKAWKSRR